MNRGSRSKPSEATSPQLIKATKAPPKIIRKQFSEGHVDCKVCFTSCKFTSRKNEDNTVIHFSGIGQ